VATYQKNLNQRGTMKEVLEMSTKELERYDVLKGVKRGILTQAKAADLLGVTDRQVRNLLALLVSKGPHGLVSMKRGRPSNRRKPAAFKQQILSIVREKYEDFGPSFAREKLAEIHKTLQDRLIKEMRLQGINTIDEANKHTGRFIEEYNRKFSKEPASQFDAHRPLENKVDLSRVLSRYEERTLTKDAVFQFHNRFYKIIKVPEGMIFRGKKVEIRIGKENHLRVFVGDVELKAIPTDEARDTFPPEPVLELQWKGREFWKPSPTHPWRGPRGWHRPYGQLQKVV
jgi:hypothetical protein